ncbi:phosphatase PAP2 family protein [Leyella lascolaii]|uniref:phosphatase PAP2 family protein n=1 Tax=Leyella lascolaii TaxID=1776379 RepID=UPI00374D1523
MGQILLIIGCAAFCILLSGGVSDFIVKPFFARERPCNDLAFKGCISLANNFRATGYSFFSSHAANTFSLAIFFILLIRSRVLSVSLILWAFTNCYTRLYLGVHYPSDIAVGLIWGGVSGYCAYKLYHCMYGKIAPQITYVSTQYTVSGYDKRDIDVVIFTIIVTLLYAVIRSVIIYI